MYSPRKLIFIAAGLLVVVALAVLIYVNRDKTTAATARIGYLNITASLPLFIAEKEGFFAEEKIQIETLQIASSNQLIDAIVAGNLDAFVEASAVPVLAVEIQSPGRLKVFSVSSITKAAPFDAILVKEDSPLKTL